MPCFFIMDVYIYLIIRPEFWKFSDDSVCYYQTRILQFGINKKLLSIKNLCSIRYAKYNLFSPSYLFVCDPDKMAHPGFFLLLSLALRDFWHFLWYFHSTSVSFLLFWTRRGCFALVRLFITWFWKVLYSSKFSLLLKVIKMNSDNEFMHYFWLSNKAGLNFRAVGRWCRFELVFF